MIPSALSDDAEVARPSLGVVAPFDAVALGGDLADGGVDLVLRRAEPFVDVRVDCGVPGVGLPAIVHVALAPDSAGVGGAEPAQYAVLVRRRPAADMVEVAAVCFLLLGEDEGSDEHLHVLVEGCLFGGFVEIWYFGNFVCHVVSPFRYALYVTGRAPPRRLPVIPLFVVREGRKRKAYTHTWWVGHIFHIRTYMLNQGDTMY